MASIYGLFDRDGNLRYIGKANDPAKRLKGHMREVRRHTPLYDWLAKHGRPEMRVLEADCEDWREAERRLISEARVRGERLLNLADGGDEPLCSLDTRRANGHKLVARIRGDAQFSRLREAKRALTAAIQQGFLSNARRAQLRERAKRMPSMFGSFAHIPDRQEDEQGRAWVQSGKHRVQVR